MSRCVAWTTLALGLVLALQGVARAGDEPAKQASSTAARAAADLASKDLDTRRKAAFALWQAGTEASGHAKALANALRDQDDYVRSTVEKVLARMGWQQSLGTLAGALPELIAALKDERASVRLAAVNLIWNAGPIPNVVGGDPPPPELVPALVTALEDEHAGVRANAAASLANLQGSAKDALPALRRRLEDSDEKVRTWSVRAVSWIEPATAVDSVLPLAKDHGSTVRAAVFEALGNAPAASSDPALAALLIGFEDADAEVRRAAINGVWALGRSEALAALAERMNYDEDVSIRSLAAEAMGGLGDPAAAPLLVAALSGKDESVYGSAVAGLSRLGPEGVAGLPRMIELLSKGPPAVRRRIALAMGSLAAWSKPALPAMVAALKDEDGSVRAMAASSLSAVVQYGIESADLREAVIAGLSDKADAVRQYCVGIVATLGPEMTAAVPELLPLVGEDNGMLGNTQVFYALQQIGPGAKEALPVLRRYAAGTGYDRSAAAAALACVSEDPKEIDGAVQILIDMMKDKAERTGALYRLKSIGPRASRTALILRVWMKSDTPFRWPAAGALLRIEGGKAKDALATLAEGLRGEDPTSALRAIRGVGADAAALAPALLDLAGSVDSPARARALRTLDEIGARDPEVRAAFAAVRHDSDPMLRGIAARGLARLGE